VISEGWGRNAVSGSQVCVCVYVVTNEDETSAGRLGRQKRKEMKLRVTAAVRGKCADSRRLRGIVVLDGDWGAETGAFAFLADADQTFSQVDNVLGESRPIKQMGVCKHPHVEVRGSYDETAETWSDYSDTYYTLVAFTRWFSLLVQYNFLGD
jgi:hypothetical protein